MRHITCDRCHEEITKDEWNGQDINTLGQRVDDDDIWFDIKMCWEPKDNISVDYCQMCAAELLLESATKHLSNLKYFATQKVLADAEKFDKELTQSLIDGSSVSL